MVGKREGLLVEPPMKRLPLGSSSMVGPGSSTPANWMAKTKVPEEFTRAMTVSHAKGVTLVPVNLTVPGAPQGLPEIKTSPLGASMVLPPPKEAKGVTTGRVPRMSQGVAPDCAVSGRESRRRVRRTARLCYCRTCRVLSG